MDFHKPSWADCPHKAPYTKDDIWTEIKSDSDLDASDSETSRSDYHSHEGLPDHPRDFEHLAFTAGLIVNKISDNRLDTFSWELETCIPEAILGPRGIITTRQRLLSALSIITNSCCRGNTAIPATQGSTIDLSSFRKLKSLRWRAPRAEDIPALLSALTMNRRHLERLELDLRECYDDEDVYLLSLQESVMQDSAFLRKLLRIQHTPSTPMFPQLRKLSLLSTTVGPGLAQGLDFGTLSSLRFRDCHGLPGFFATLAELGVQPRIKAFEIYSSYSLNDLFGQEEELEEAVARFLSCFRGLVDLVLRVAPGPWFPKHEFWSSLLTHRPTLQNCVLEELAWECINRSWGASTTTITDIEETDSTGVSYGVEDWGCQLRKERVSGGVLSPSIYRLQEEFCDFIEWAFGHQGIHSLRTIAVGDFSAAGPCQSRLCISVDDYGMLRVLKGRDKRMAYPLEKFREFIRLERDSLNDGGL
ncbi:hypothetical protein BHE90_009563 [Fusarium euwallaceae]|uniref:Uncharacterized protein n=1 Tax=Fusarium euwallaceae TaxID=1147111 RepID=A0A430LJV4_9HYPO|nr:hypothetical protein BHE90_009563 [Fusarium euwallaceae]